MSETTSKLTELISKLDQLNMSTINSYYKEHTDITSGVEGNSKYVELVDLAGEEISTDITVAIDFIQGTKKHGMMVSLKHTAGEVKIDLVSNSFTDQQFIDDVVFIKNNRIMYIKLSDGITPGTNGNSLKIRLVSNKSTILKMLNDIVDYNSIKSKYEHTDGHIKLTTGQDTIISNSAFSIYQDINGDVIFDTYGNKLKVKNYADGSDGEVFVTGDPMYGFSTKKIKENIKDVPEGIFTSFIDNIDVKRYNYIESFDSEKREDVSIIIEELKDSNAPKELKDILFKELDRNGEKLESYRVNTMIMIMLGAIKEQQKTINELKGIVSKLNADK